MRVVRTLPKELENEALKSFDEQGDQLIYHSDTILAVGAACKESGNAPPSGIDDEGMRRAWEEMFWYVFGYAIAKGWKRRKPFDP